MELYHETAQDAKGNITNGATVTVTVASSGAPATIYDAAENALSNPFSSGYDRSNGEIDFRAIDGKYIVQVVGDTTVALEVALFDSDEYTPTAPTRHSVRPSLLLDFANSGGLDSRITFTRASIATYFDGGGVLQVVASGEPRFDHDPITGESLGLLIEESRTNFLKYSAQLDNAVWNTNGVVVSADAAVAPDATVTMEEVAEDNTNSSHSMNQVYIASTGVEYAFSIYVKKLTAGSTRYLQVVPPGSWVASAWANFDIVNGIIGSFGGSGLTSGIEDVGGGIYRCWIKFTCASGGSGSMTFGIVTSSSSGRLESYTGDGVSGVYAWGAQLEEGSFPSSYIPTTTAQVTRAADVAVMTGTNFSDWYNQIGGSVYVNYTTESAAAYAASFVNSSGVFNDVIGLLAGTSGSIVDVVSGGVAQASIGSRTQSGVFACSVIQDDFAVSLDGGAVATDVSGLMPVGVDKFSIGAYADGSLPINGHIKKLAYYPKALTDIELVELTL